VQEIFLDLWRGAARYDRSIGSETTFVAMIARRRLIDRRRSRERRPATEAVPEISQAQTQSAELSAEAALAAKALETLRPEQRQVLVLGAYHGFSHEEIAESTGMPLGTVKAHARRGLLRVREVLAAGSTQVVTMARSR
jgi:RNA polymerase sigma-70 factor (ECF subfamily)